jgi:tripartite-type tricarboxylate transporter receptor subunit TctC
MKAKQRFLPFAVVAAVCLGFSCMAAAQAPGYPSGPVKIIVPFTAGSATDIMARVAGERLAPALGQAVIVENRPGAGGTIGINVVAKAAPDGMTLAVVSTGHVVNHVLYSGLPYDTIKDFAGVAPLATLPSVLIVSPALGVKSVADLVAVAKARPGQLNYGTAGVGSAAHINQEKFNQATGIQAVHIPFKGTPEILGDTMAGRVQMAWVPLVSSVGPIRDGTVLALAVSTPRRSATLPDVPTIAEAGVPGGEFNFWVGLLAPAKTPREVVARLNAEVNKAMQSPETLQRLAKMGAEPMPMSAEQYDAFIRQQYEELGRVMKASGVKPQ